MKKTLQKMDWKTINLKFITKFCVLSLFLFGMTGMQAQVAKPLNSQKDSVITAKDKMNIISQADTSIDTSGNDFQRYKVDGVAAVIGDYLVLESDIKKFRIDIENRMSESENITNCQLLGRLMENKLFSHAALQDSTVYQNISDGRIKTIVEQKISQLVRQIGSMEKLLKYYRKDNEAELRDELFKIIKENQMAEAMQNHITEGVEITPEEVRQYFDSIPKDERPKFSDEVEIAQLVIKPKIPQTQIDKVVERLNKMRDEILNGSSSFATKAVLYSEDNTSSNGGKMTITRDDPLDKDFKQIAFSLREGEISKPFKSSFGYHIVKVDKVLGQKRVIRHIILIPKETKASLKAAKARIDSIRTQIEDGDISFDQAARKYSDDDETRGDGGQLINPESGDKRFELTKIDPRMYNEVKRLKKGQVSKILSDQTRTGKKFYKIITLTGRYPEHIADYSKDYAKIKNLALQQKKFKAIQEWRQKEIEDSYIMINDSYEDCDFEANWLKK